ncbi:MAG: ubiquinol-cytochrome c reductase iron-sulfur subunit [Deltaproteobacteria bacterium]|nr:ubiquinol-cytochrome c reductase iron-sulfur subunit [Deltaproteobacteria bacterium]MBI4373943.1 ubiquinol-cytochrome c reductase iron-sulfur subunit [Deltaproteobacteria bacterium]
MQTNIPGSEKFAEKPVESNLWTRRDFFGFAGWGAFLSAIGLGLIGFLRLLYPRVLFEPSPIFKIGKPEDFVEGEISEKFKEEQRVWVVREAGKIYAVLAICTHLGCTPRWLPLEGKFKCPCHGSGFTKEGVNFEGPAPRPLERLAIRLDDEGTLVVDKSRKYLYERGEWEDSGSFVTV